MTEKGTPSIYDIPFDVIDEKKYQELRKGHPAETNETTQALPPEQLGKVAVSTEVMVCEPREAPSSPHVPPEMVEIATALIDSLVAHSPKNVVPIVMLVDRAFGQKIPWSQYRDFKNALIQDGRLEYMGSGDFRIVDAKSTAVYWPGEIAYVDVDYIDKLADGVLQAMEAATRSPRFLFLSTGILGIVKGMGEYLSANEANELLARIASNPMVTSLEGGGFRFNKDFADDPDMTEDGLRMPSLDFGENSLAAEDKRPMTRGQVRRTMKKIDRSSAIRNAVDLAKRRANPRRRRKRFKKNKLQGRTHNQTQAPQGST